MDPQELAKKGKIVPSCCLILAMGIQFGIMYPYMSLAGDASRYNETY